MPGDIKLGGSNRGTKKKWTSEVHSLNGNQCASSFIRRMFANGLCLCRVVCSPGTIASCSWKKMQAKSNHRLEFSLVVFFISGHLCSEMSSQIFCLSTLYSSLYMQ